ncbi:MAG: tRNA 2-thiouridine synthesizing protein C [Pseudohongiellaceae bacterium]|jgi:tRNA 2-thiouridine synthesizing protein C
MTTEISYLFISRCSPYAGQQARAALDLAFTAAAFEQKVSFVFIDDGVLQLLDRQDTQASQLKNIGKMIPALKHYDVENIYIHQPSLARAGLKQIDLPNEFKLLDDEKLGKLVATTDQVMVF